MNDKVYPVRPPNQPGVLQDQPIETFQPIRMRPKRRKRRVGCVLPVLLLILLLVLVPTFVYLVFPSPVNFLILGIDRAPEGTALGRSDTIIMIHVKPLEPSVGMLSIPRDLWVYIPGIGENRINTAHFFAEANQAGSGPQAALDTITANFQITIPYYIRFQFNGFKEVVQAMGGVTIELESPTGGYPAGRHVLDADQALAFVRDRSGSDDFFRMQRGQIFIKAVIRQMILPTTWPQIPNIAAAVFRNLDTNIPLWQWPRIAVVGLLTGIEGIDSRTITREMVTPFTTSEGANVLLPRWDAILPVIQEMFFN